MAALTEEQTLIKDQANAWANAEGSVTAFRAMRDAGTANGFNPDTWREIVAMGWPGILVPEAHGGSDLGLLTMGIVLEELGRQLTASPLLSAGVIGPLALRHATPDVQAQLYPKIVDGSAIIALAVDEGPRHRPESIAMPAQQQGGAHQLNGTKYQVLEGAAATHYVVAARTSGDATDDAGVSLLLVDAEAPGIERTPLITADSRGYAHVSFNNTEVPAENLLGSVDGGSALLQELLDGARAALGAEMLGCAAQSFDMTLEYLKTRVQFGQVIGSFQALGHRAADLFTEMELARSCAEAALQAIDNKADDVASLASMSKCKVGDFLHHMSNELIQIHGGIGMTDEFDAGLYLKRARALEPIYGNQAYHRDRYARLQGF